MSGDSFEGMGRHQADWDARSRAAQAYTRLLKLAETRDSGQIRRVAQFLASIYHLRSLPF